MPIPQPARPTATPTLANACHDSHINAELRNWVRGFLFTIPLCCPRPHVSYRPFYGVPDRSPTLPDACPVSVGKSGPAPARPRGRGSGAGAGAGAVGALDKAKAGAAPAQDLGSDSAKSRYVGELAASALWFGRGAQQGVGGRRSRSSSSVVVTSAKAISDMRKGASMVQAMRRSSATTRTARGLASIHGWSSSERGYAAGLQSRSITNPSSAAICSQPRYLNWVEPSYSKPLMSSVDSGPGASPF